MIPIIPLILRIRLFRDSLRWLRRQRTHTGKVVLLPVAAAFMALCSCNEEPVDHAPTVAVTDTQPVGEGLKVIGYALLGAAVVGVLGRMLK